MVNENIPNFNNINPFLARNRENTSEANVKLNEDQYDVYVNGNLVGQKALKNQGENLSDIDDFLRVQGISNFSSSLNGDHYVITTNEQSTEIEEALSFYFNNR